MIWRIFLYMSGCVNMGSSISLWPLRRYDTRSTTTSLWNVDLHSAATWNARQWNTPLKTGMRYPLVHP